MNSGRIRLADILEPFEELLGTRPEPELLTLTEKNGFMAQREKYNKRVAREDTRDYKVIRKYDIAFNPYLLWAGAIAQNVSWDIGLISPLYPTFHVRDGYDPRFVDYILRGDPLVARYDTIAFGSVPRRRRSSVSDFLALWIPKPPPLPEQRRIAGILDKADEVRARRRSAIAELDTLTQSIFVDMFGDPAANPKGIRRRPLGELIQLKSGEFLPAIAMAESGRYAVLGGNGISGFHDQYIFEEPQIVIGRVGAYCGCVHVSPPKSWITDNALFVSERDPDLLFEYLVHALTYARLNQYASQFGQPLVSGSRIYPVSVLVPPKDGQEHFARRAGRSAALKDAHQQALQGLDELFTSLQYRASRGDL